MGIIVIANKNKRKKGNSLTIGVCNIFNHFIIYFFQTYHNLIFYEHITIENLLPLMKLYI